MQSSFDMLSLLASGPGHADSWWRLRGWLMGFFFFGGGHSLSLQECPQNPPPPPHTQKKKKYKQLFGLLWRNLSCQSNIMTTCTPNCLIVAECKKKKVVNSKDSFIFLMEKKAVIFKRTTVFCQGEKLQSWED